MVLKLLDKLQLLLFLGSVASQSYHLQRSQVLVLQHLNVATFVMFLLFAPYISKKLKYTLNNRGNHQDSCVTLTGMTFFEITIECSFIFFTWLLVCFLL